MNDSDEEGTTSHQVWEHEYSGKNGIVFLVDARRPMFHTNKSTTYFYESIQCCRDVMLQIAREQRYDYVALVVFGTVKSDGKLAPPHVALVQPLFTPTVEKITQLNDMLSDNFETFTQKYGKGHSISVSESICYCESLLHKCRHKLYNRTIIMFTYDDDPHKDDIKGAHRARKQAEELYLHRIELDVVGMGSFDSSKFYKELVLSSKHQLLKDWEGVDPIKRIEDVQKGIMSIAHKFNRHFGVLYLGEGVKINVLLYKLYHEPKKLMWITPNRKMGEETLNNEGENKVASQSNNVTDDHGDQQDQNTAALFDEDTQPLEKRGEHNKVMIAELEEPEEEEREKPKSYPLIGGQLIPMTKVSNKRKYLYEICPDTARLHDSRSKKELQWYEAKVDKGLTLLGFRPLAAIPPHLTTGEPYFVLPDTRYSSSEGLFSQLLDACLEELLAPVCWWSLTKSGQPSLTALIPSQSSEYAMDKSYPPGFHLIRIPFSDMITDYEDEHLEGEPSEVQKEAAEGIVKKITLPYSPDMFSDAEYRSRMAMIEALAMGYKDVEEVEDCTDVDLDDISAQLGELSVMFTDASHLPETSVRAPTTGKRGGRSQAAEVTRQPKEARMEDTVSLIGVIKEGKANSLTVAQLREILRGEGIKSLSAMTKARLVNIAEHRFCTH